MKLKVCGITNSEDLNLCSGYAGAVGIIVDYPDSPRSVPITQARQMMEAAEAKAPIVIVIPDFSRADEIIRELKPEIIQLHGAESPEQVKVLKEKAGCKIIKACSLPDADRYESVSDLLLIDDKYSKYSLQDAKAFIEKSSKPVILAGGVSLDNAYDFIAANPCCIDVASGVEREPGKKDLDAVRLLAIKVALGAVVGGIVGAKKRCNSEADAGEPDSVIAGKAEVQAPAEPGKLYNALAGKRSIIAEVKPASPSEGELRAIDGDAGGPGGALPSIVSAMEEGGASAISVLVEEERFGGSIELLRQVRALTGLPILAKGFFYQEGELDEAASAGADAFLLMVRVAEAESAGIGKLIEHASALNLDAVAEAAAPGEIEAALDAGARIILVNNRDIYGGLAIDFRNSKMGSQLPEGVVFITASGINFGSDIAELDSLTGGRADAFLVGSSIMKGDVESKVAELVKACNEVRQ